MSLVPVKYPLDLTGTAVTNKVADEAHQLNNSIYRVFVPKSGAFFTDSVAVRDAATNRVLVKGVDYYPAVLYRQPTRQTGKEVHQIIVIVDRTCGANILFDAQILGGEYSYSYDAIVQMVQNLDLDNRPVEFEAIIGKPTSWNPTPHLHDIGDVYGFEYQVAALERVRQAILLGSGASTKAIYDYLKNQIVEINNTIDVIRNNQSTPASVIDALGFTPVDKAGDTFSGPMTFNQGISNQGFYKEKIKRITATSTTTPLDLSLAGIFSVTLASSTTFSFSVANVPAIGADESISFTLIIKNDGTAGRAVAFGNNVRWADKVIPPRSTGINAQDEFYFSSFDGGVTWTGSLSNQNVGQAA